MTKDELLQAEGEELSRMLGEVLKREHCFGTVSPFTGNKTAICWNCGKHETGDDGTCTIPLNDWNVAMKWRDWAVEEVGICIYKDALWQVYKDDKMRLSGHSSGEWFTYAKPKHYLKAAALCKLESEVEQCGGPVSSE